MIYKQANTLQMVAEFHELFDQPILSKPQIPELDRAKLRVSLMQEELDELNKAIDDWNLLEVADALWDLEYVLMWSILEFGLWSYFGDVFEDIHSSNMSKLCDSIEQAEETIKRYKSNKWWEYTYKERWNKFVILREDGKVIKSIYYKPIDITKILKINTKKSATK